MAMVLSCVTMVATVGRSASAKIASAGVILTCPVIAESVSVEVGIYRHRGFSTLVFSC